MKRLSLMLTPLLLLALLLGATGCEKEKATPAPTATATAKTTATPALPLKPEGELKIALANLFGMAFDPQSPGATPAKTYLNVMYDFLVGADFDGNLSTELGIARKWEHSADYLSWTFYLREGVKFHNGDALTAEDVEFTLQQLGGGQATVLVPGAQARTTSSSAAEIFRTIDKIVVDGPYQITVKLKQPMFFLDYQLSPLGGNDGMVRPKKYLSANGYDYFQLHPIASGPYRLAEFVAGQSMKLEAADNHFAWGVPKYKYITLYQAPEEITRIAMLKGGQVDVIDIGRQTVAGMQKDGYNIFRSKLDDAVFLSPTSYVGTSNPLSDPKVREALWLAINKKVILDNLLLGQAEEEGQNSYYPYVLGSQDLPPKPYDPEKAKQLLKEAGYPERFANPTIDIYSFVRAGFPEGPAMLEAIAADWMKVGVKVKITPTEFATFVSGFRARNLVNVVYHVSYAPNKLAATTTAGSRSVPPGSSTNFTVPPDTGYDALVDAQAAAKTADEYIAAATKIFRYVYDNARIMNLFRLKRLYATNQKVKQWDLGYYLWDYLNLPYLVKR